VLRQIASHRVFQKGFAITSHAFLNRRFVMKVSKDVKLKLTTGAPMNKRLKRSTMSFCPGLVALAALHYSITPSLHYSARP
jgi:hypothetical protein